MGNSDYNTISLVVAIAILVFDVVLLCRACYLVGEQKGLANAIKIKRLNGGEQEEQENLA